MKIAGFLFLLGTFPCHAAIDADVKRVREIEFDSRREEPLVVWRAKVGDLTGAISLAPGRVLVGARISEEISRGGRTYLKDSGGAMVCLNRETGALLWRTVHPPVSYHAVDLGEPLRAPCIGGSRAWYLSNRAELVCVDLAGSPRNPSSSTGKGAATQEPAIVWNLDMGKELGVYRRGEGDVGCPSGSPVILGDLVYCVTGEGLRIDGRPSTAPSFLAVRKTTGEIAWSSHAPGQNVIFAQWSSPVVAQVGGRNQVIFPGGDGWLYGFEPMTGEMIWKVDCNALSGMARKSEGVGTPDALKEMLFFMGAPVVHNDTLFVGLNYLIEHPSSLGPLLAISLGHSGNVTGQALRWSFQHPEFGSTYVSAAIADGIVYVLGHRSTLFALDEKTGGELWHSTFSDDSSCYFGSPLVSHGRVYVMSEGGDLFVYATGSKKKCLAHWEFEDLSRDGPVADEESVYVPTRRYLWKIRAPD